MALFKICLQLTNMEFLTTHKAKSIEAIWKDLQETYKVIQYKR